MCYLCLLQTVISCQRSSEEQEKKLWVLFQDWAAASNFNWVAKTIKVFLFIIIMAANSLSDSLNQPWISKLKINLLLV